jgi:predicted PurR-regulated permease PerM
MTASPTRTDPEPAPARSRSLEREYRAPDDHRSGLNSLIIAIAVVAALYFGRDIFIPIALAILLTFALAPLVARLRRLKVPRVVAVLTVVAGAFAVLLLVAAIFTTQLAQLAGNIPLYRDNITAKVRIVRDMQAGSGILDRWTDMLRDLGREMEEAEEDAEEPAGAPPGSPAAEQQEDAAADPLPVEVVEPELQPLQMLRAVVLPLIAPLATAGIVIVFVIFMLLRREDLRDRFIRLVGASDLHRTTSALHEAGRRVGRYLLMQLVVNVTYAIPVGLGLWFIGVPNALLWALLAMVLRFVPYIGPIIAAMFPLALALAVDPGWTMVLWTAALFVTLELISNNFMEPWLYGSGTGLSPVAIIVAAIFWTWLWGPIGLLLSTPLTVCLVVLGRHVPQFEFLEVLLGNQPVLAPPEQLYQRLLAGDPDEATERAEEYLETADIATFYDEVAIPALVLGEHDRARGVLEERRRRVAQGAMTLVENLEELDDVIDETPGETGPTAPAMYPAGTVPTKGPASRRILCAGGRGELDDAAAMMLAQVLERKGWPVWLASSDAMGQASGLREELLKTDLIFISYLNAESVAHARYTVRRLRRLNRKAVIGVVFWDEGMRAETPEHLREAIRCDFLVRSIGEAVAQASEPDLEAPKGKVLAA